MSAEDERSGRMSKGSPKPLVDRLREMEDEERLSKGLPPIDRSKPVPEGAAPAYAYRHQRAAVHIQRAALKYAFWLAAAAFLTGLLLIIVGAAGVTSFSTGKSSFSTTNVGIAALAIGALLYAWCLWMTYKVAVDLAHLPDN